MFGKKCDVCERKTTENLSQSYVNNDGKEILVCLKCVEYAEENNFEKV